MDPELTEAEVEALEKLNAQVQNIIESMRIQAAYQAEQTDLMKNMMRGMIQDVRALKQHPDYVVESKTPPETPQVRSITVRPDSVTENVAPVGEYCYNSAHENSSSDQHQYVSPSTKPDLIFEDTTKIVAGVNDEDLDGIDFDLDSDLVLSKPTVIGIVHTEIISIDPSSSLVLQKHESKNENVESGVGTSVCALNGSLNDCPASVRQYAHEMIVYSLSSGKPPPLPPEVASNLVIYQGDPTQGANTMTNMSNFLKTVDVAVELRDLVHSGIVPKHKVDFDDKSEFEMFQNYEDPQGIFNKLRITKRNEGIRLMIENWKFMPWVKRYSDSYDMFLVDKWIISLLPQLLEEQLYMRRKIPVLNNLTHMTWNGLIMEETGSGLFYSRTGTCMVKVSRGSFNVKEIIENVMYAIVGIIHIVSNKWEGLMSIHLKLSEPLSGHNCQTLPDLNLKMNGAERIEKKMLEEGEVTDDATKYEIVRKESSKSSSMYGVRYMIIKMNNLVYFLVKAICKKEFKFTWQHVWGICHNSSGSFVHDRQISIMFTHHQKIVVIDHEMLNEVSANTSKCSSGVGQNASMNYSSYFLMRANSNSYIMMPAMKVDDSSVLLMNTCHYYEEESSLLSFLQLWEGKMGVQKFLYFNGVAGNFVFDKGKVHKYNKKNDLKIYKGCLPAKSQPFRISDFETSTTTTFNSSLFVASSRTNASGAISSTWPSLLGSSTLACGGTSPSVFIASSSSPCYSGREKNEPSKCDYSNNPQKPWYVFFSSPRPPEVANLEDKVNFKEGGMLRNGILWN